MTANTAPIFSLTPFIASAQVSAANTNRDGTGTIVTVTAGTPNGRRVDRINIKGTVTTTAGMVRLYIDDGTNVRLWKEIPVTAITVSASAAGFESSISPTDQFAPLLVLPSSSYILKASTHNAEAINVIALGGDF
jgi:hypothetical protein